MSRLGEQWPSSAARQLGEPLTNLAWLCTRLMLLPVSVFVSSLEALLSGLRPLASADELATTPASMPVAVTGAVELPRFVPINQVAQQAATAIDMRRNTVMPDMNLSDDMVKLVRFTIVTIKRDDEHVLGEKDGGEFDIARGEKVVTDNLTDDAFSSWVISEYFQQANPERVEPDDKKYLRVHYEVLSRWAKQDRKFEKNQIDKLAGIDESLRKIVQNGVRLIQ